MLEYLKYLKKFKPKLKKYISRRDFITLNFMSFKKMLNKKDLKDIYNFSERELLKIIKTSRDKIKKYSNKNPNEVKKTIMGGGLGAGLATLF